MTFFSRAMIPAALVAAGLATAAGPAGAQAPDDGLSGVLLKIKHSGAVTLGYRTASFPFSYLDHGGRPVGYSLDLCLSVVEHLKTILEKPDLQVKYAPIAPGDRVSSVVTGLIDLECGSSTANRIRQKDVAFSPVIFVTGTKLMVRRGSGIRSYRDLKGKTVAVSTGTTNEAALKALIDKQKLDIKLVPASDLDGAMAALEAGTADAFGSDEVLLYGALTHAKQPRDYEVVGEFLSYEPYGLMFAKGDPGMSRAVEETFAEIMANKDVLDIYDRWFVRRLPSGEQLNLPMNAQLVDIFEGLGLPD